MIFSVPHVVNGWSELHVHPDLQAATCAAIVHMYDSALSPRPLSFACTAAAGSPVKAAAGKARAAADEGAAAAAAGTASQQLQGGLQVLLQLPLSVAGRDYLRRGECGCLQQGAGWALLRHLAKWTAGYHTSPQMHAWS